MSEQLLTTLTGFSVFVWIMIFLFSKDVKPRKYDWFRGFVAIFVGVVLWKVITVLPALRVNDSGHSLPFRGHIFALIGGCLVVGCLFHSWIFNERWTLKTLSLLILSFALACRGFTFNDILLSGTIVGLFVFLYSQAPLIANRDPQKEELALGLFFFVCVIAGFTMSASLFESNSGTLILSEVVAGGESKTPKALLGWLFGFSSSLLVLMFPFFGLFQKGIHRSKSWPIHNWLLGLVVLVGVSSCLAWIDASQVLFMQQVSFAKGAGFLIAGVLGLLAVIQGCLSRRITSLLQTWTMTPLIIGFVAYALGSPEGEILAVISFAMWIFGLIAVGGALTLLDVGTEATVEQLSKRLQEAERFSRGLFLFSIAILSPIGSLIGIKVITLTLESDFSWAQPILGASGTWAFPLFLLFLVSAMVVAFLVPVMRVYPASTQSNSVHPNRPLQWAQVRVALLLVPVIVVGIYTTHLYKYMAKTFMP